MRRPFLTQSCGNLVFVILFSLAGIVVAGLPVGVWILYTQCDFEMANGRCETQIGWLIASCFVGVTLPISIWEIVMHLRYMHNPMLQVNPTTGDMSIIHTVLKKALTGSYNSDTMDGPNLRSRLVACSALVLHRS